MDKKKYIKELFEVVVDVPGLSKGDLGSVTAIRMDLRLIDIYVVKGKPYYYYNFVLYFE
jgi:hypothetical protein